MRSLLRSCHLIRRTMSVQSSFFSVVGRDFLRATRGRVRNVCLRDVIGVLTL